MDYLPHTVLSEEDGRTVRSILKYRMGCSSHAIARICRIENGILVNGRPAHTNAILHTGDVVQVLIRDTTPPKIPVIPGDWPLEIVWEDAFLMVLNKPAGMTAHASNFLPDTPTVAGALAYQKGTDAVFHPVNRLDKGTTGLMVAAKNGYIHNLLRQMLHTNSFYREYRGLCVGIPEPPAGIIDAPIGRNIQSTVARMVRPDGVHAVSHYITLERRGRFSLVRLIPETGRTHQLRVHMAHIGCPLAGDWLYGVEDQTLIARPALHSYKLQLKHPVTGQTLLLTAPLPEDMQRIWESETEE